MKAMTPSEASKPILRRGPGLLLLCLLPIFIGCVTHSPARYYTLDMRPSGSVTPPHAFQVERFQVAQALSRDEIMIKMSPTEVEYYATDRWVAHIGELVARKLQVELEQENPDPEAPKLEVAGTIHAFEQVDTPDGAEVYVALEIIVRKPTDSRHALPRFQRHYRENRPTAGPGPVDTVTTLSRVMEEIARQFAVDVADMTYDN